VAEEGQDELPEFLLVFRGSTDIKSDVKHVFLTLLAHTLAQLEHIFQAIASQNSASVFSRHFTQSFDRVPSTINIVVTTLED